MMLIVVDKLGRCPVDQPLGNIKNVKNLFLAS
jgi:hypothetical protein